MITTDQRPDWTVRVCDSLEKVVPDREPRTFDADIPLVAFRGEQASFQIAVLPPALAHAVTLGELKIDVAAPDGVRAVVSSVELVPVALAAFEDADEHYLFREPGLYPDLLRPAPSQTFRPVVGQWRAAWVDLHVSCGTAAGAVSVGIEVRSTAEGEIIASFELPLSIPEALLPPLDIPHAEWFHCDGPADYYGHEPFSEENWAVIERFVESAVRVQVNTMLTPTWTPPLDTDVGTTRTRTQLLGITDIGDGRYDFDFERLRRWVRMCREHGIRYLEIPHLFTQWGAHATPAIYVQTPDGLEQRFGWHVRAGDPSYRALMQQLLPQLLAVLSAEWSLDRVFFHISDEPEAGQIQAYRDAHAVVADLLDGCVVIDALSDLELYRSGFLSSPVVAIDHADAFLDAGMDSTWLYYCVSQSREVSNRFIALPSTRNRVLGTQLFLTGAAGFLHWGFNFYNSYLSTRRIDPFRDTCAGDAFLGGDAFLVYPGEDGTPLESIRHRVLGEAFTDYRALRLLARLRDDEFARGLVDQGRTVRLDSFSYDADHYRRAFHEVVRSIEDATDA